ncbi:hypothetical protein Gotur_027160, partial [Gossypium turneri]
FTSAWDSESLPGYICTYVFVRFSSPHSHREIKLVMEKGFLDKVEYNAAVRAWSETTQHEKGDSLAKGYISKLWDFTCISVTQNRLQELKEIWDQWNEEVRQLFYSNYGDLPYLLDIKWVTARIQQKGDSKCILWKSLKDIILAHPDTKKRVDVFALSIYGLVIFPKVLGHIDEAVIDLAGEGRFVGYAQLLLAWFYSHFWRVDKNLREEDVEWRAPWLLPDEILYQCGDFDWVPLLGIWGAVGYAPLLVLR